MHFCSEDHALDLRRRNVRCAGSDHWHLPERPRLLSANTAVAVYEMLEARQSQ